MNVAVINRSYWRDGGVPIAARNWVEALAKRGMKVIVFATDVEEADSNDQVTFIKVWSKAIKTLDLGGFIFAVSLLFCLKSLHARHKLNLLQVHDSQGYLGAYLFEKLYRVPAVIFFHGWIYNPWRAKAYRKSQTLVYKLNAHFCARYAKTVGCVSQEIVDGLKTLGADESKLHLFHNSLDLDRWTCSPDAGTPREERVVLFVGRFAREKGVEYLLRAIPHILETLPKTVFMFIGGGASETEKQVMEKLANDLNIGGSVRFLGKIPHDCLGDYYARADVLVMPSLSEGHAIVPLEALACGTPVIGTRIPGIIETIADGYNGLLVAPENPGAIAEAVIRVLGNEALRTTLGQHARPSVEKYSWDHAVRKLLSLAGLPTSRP
jgi:glycosyltransferase involved in cell wall biosynthesis